MASVVECAITFTDGRQVTRTAPVSGDGKDALESLSTALLTLKDTVNADITKVVEEEKASGKNQQKRPSSQIDNSDGKYTK